MPGPVGDLNETVFALADELVRSMAAVGGRRSVEIDSVAGQLRSEVPRWHEVDGALWHLEVPVRSLGRMADDHAWGTLRELGIPTWTRPAEVAEHDATGLLGARSAEPEPVLASPPATAGNIPESDMGSVALAESVLDPLPAGAGSIPESDIGSVALAESVLDPLPAGAGSIPESDIGSVALAESVLDPLPAGAGSIPESDIGWVRSAGPESFGTEPTAELPPSTGIDAPVRAGTGGAAVHDAPATPGTSSAARVGGIALASAADGAAISGAIGRAGAGVPPPDFVPPPPATIQPPAPAQVVRVTAPDVRWPRDGAQVVVPGGDRIVQPGPAGEPGPTTPGRPVIERLPATKPPAPDLPQYQRPSVPSPGSPWVAPGSGPEPRPGPDPQTTDLPVTTRYPAAPPTHLTADPIREADYRFPPHQDPVPVGSPPAPSVPPEFAADMPPADSRTADIGASPAPDRLPVTDWAPKPSAIDSPGGMVWPEAGGVPGRWRRRAEKPPAGLQIGASGAAATPAPGTPAEPGPAAGVSPWSGPVPGHIPLPPRISLVPKGDAAAGWAIVPAPKSAAPEVLPARAPRKPWWTPRSRAGTEAPAPVAKPRPAGSRSPESAAPEVLPARAPRKPWWTPRSRAGTKAPAPVAKPRPTGSRSPESALVHRIAASMAISTGFGQMQSTWDPLLLFHDTGSPQMMAWAIAGGKVMELATIPAAGWLTDRFDPYQVMLAGSAGGVFLSGTVGGLIAANAPGTVGYLIGAQLGQAVVDRILASSGGQYLRSSAAPGEEKQASGLFAGATLIPGLAGGSLAPMLGNLLDAAPYLLNGASYLAYWGLRGRPHSVVATRSGQSAPYGEALAALRADPYVFRAALSMLPWTIGSALARLGLIDLLTHSELSLIEQGLLLSASGIGSAAAWTTQQRWMDRIDLRRVYPVSMSLWAVLAAELLITSDPLVLGSTYVIQGAANFALNVRQNYEITQGVPIGVRGRVAAITSLLAAGGAMAGNTAGGLLLGMGRGEVAGTAAGVLAANALLTYLYGRRYPGAGKPEAGGGSAAEPPPVSPPPGFVPPTFLPAVPPAPDDDAER
ncbi:hypothetical protein [Nocardia sp. NBC_01388]|uniref:MFS transporter n=1 Tax=Nocardia sp. NBC_01388 TaxID=2903596 RepID=UPI00324FE0DF